MIASYLGTIHALWIPAFAGMTKLCNRLNLILSLDIYLSLAYKSRIQARALGTLRTVPIYVSVSHAVAQVTHVTALSR